MCCGLVNEAGKAAVDFYGPKCDNMRNMNGRYVMSNMMKGTRSKGSRMGWRGMTIAGILCTFAHAGGTAWADTVPAWRNTVDAKAAEETMRAYTSSVIRCEWAGENPNVERFIPANMAFQFAVAGDSDVTNRVRKVLEEAAGALVPSVRSGLERLGLLNSTLQWMVRICRPGITNEAQYLSARAHPAVFRESDFDAAKLKALAKRLTGANIPLPVRINIDYVDSMAPLGKAQPGLDYPDVLPEQTFELPFGSAFVIRAPERRRKIRMSAQTYPISGMASNFIWRTTGWGRFHPWSAAFRDEPRFGHADFVYDTTIGRDRWDVMVFARMPNGMIGPPSIVSFYRPPFMQRKYEGKKLRSITYIGKSRNVPYDIGPIWIPHEWKDDYNLDSKGRILSFVRTFPGRFDEDTFSAIGELVESMSSSGFPTLTRKVEYFVSPQTGRLEYKAVGDEIRYRSGASPSRRSGE